MIMNDCYYKENEFSVHFLLAQKMNQKRAASNLFWEYHFVSCPRGTTRSPALAGSLKQYRLLLAIPFASSKMILSFQKRFVRHSSPCGDMVLIQEIRWFLESYS
jgi:hypothetical protein